MFTSFDNCFLGFRWLMTLFNGINYMLHVIKYNTYHLMNYEWVWTPLRLFSLVIYPILKTAAGFQIVVYPLIYDAASFVFMGINLYGSSFYLAVSKIAIRSNIWCRINTLHALKKPHHFIVNGYIIIYFINYTFFYSAYSLQP